MTLAPWGQCCVPAFLYRAHNCRTARARTDRERDRDRETETGREKEKKKVSK